MWSSFVLFLKAIARPVEYFFKEIIRKLFKKTWIKKIIKNGNYKNIPIYIISYNRLGYIKQTVDWLKFYGYHNIQIIDNKSTYEPLLEYYKTCGCKVHYMKKNYGYLVFYKSPKFFFKRNFSFYVLTDPDLMPINNCKEDFVEVFFKVMLNHAELSKVGFSLKIDDLPDQYYLKNEVLKWETRFYEAPFYDDNLDGISLYNAGIDTTFALNAPFIFVAHKNKYFAIRVGEPYQLRHLPWYMTDNTEEIENYCRTIRKDMTNWNGNFSEDEIKQRNEEALLKEKS